MNLISDMRTERLVLNTLMTFPAAQWSEYWANLNADLFADPRNQSVFQAIEKLHISGVNPDDMAVLNQLSRMDAHVGTNEKYLLTFGSEMASVSSLQYQIESLVDIHCRREMQKLCQAGIATANDLKSEIAGKDAMQNLAMALLNSKTTSQEKTHHIITDAGKKYLQILQSRTDTFFSGEVYMRGVSSGLIALDNKLRIENGELVIIGARPSMGKTTLMQNFVLHAAHQQKKPILIMSAEMPSEAIYERMINAVGRVDAHKARSGDLSTEDWERVTRASAHINKLPIEINDMKSPTVADVRNSALKLKNTYGEVGAIFVDYLQLMKHVGNKNDHQTTLVGNTSSALKGLAKEFDCPVVALSQLNRSLESRPNKRPVMSDLRESGNIEQDADAILFLYRDEVYNKKSDQFGVAEIIIGKYRNGALGTAYVAATLEHCQFSNLAVPFEGEKA